MTHTQSSAIAIAFAALLAGPAIAADAPVTRDQVKAELAEAVSSGNFIVDESGTRMNELFPHNYPAQQYVASKTREQVNAELAEAVRTGNVTYSESGVRLNEALPHNYPAQNNVASKTREQVQRELAEAQANGQIRFIGA